ncbi:MAG: hypothetical protein PVJ76_21585 [Gemmatimonadota bacterium]|jgi:hypothetical protein
MITTVLNILILTGSRQVLPGASSDSGLPLGWIHLALGIVAGLTAAVLTIWFLVKPGEKGKDHIKRRALRERKNRKLETEG